MIRWTWIAVLAIAISWLFLLLPWVSIPQTTLTGAELSDLLTLVPGLAILTLLISLYGKGVRFLQLMAGGSLLASGISALATDFARSPVSIQAQEAISGLAGEDGLAVQLVTPQIFGLGQIAGAMLCIYLLRVRVTVRKSLESKEETDPRGIWESQS